ncbi:MAG TPA: TonB-dependent receptor [Prolixibacteraceae bacterium]|nr:TonB-dependent receptor [Prolixibacteraceae bacterium]
MQINRVKRSILLLFFLLLTAGYGFAQQKTITLTVKKQPLSLVFNQLATTDRLRFAFDNDYFSGIIASFSVTNMEVQSFLKYLSEHYPMGFKSIGGTWVLFKAERMKPIPRREIPRVQLSPQPIIEKKKEQTTYKKSRLYYFTGSVRNAFSGEKIAFCRVVVPGGKSVLTDEQGFFSSEYVGIGKIPVQIDHLGYHSLDTLVILGESMYIDIGIEPLTLSTLHKSNPQKIKFQVDFLDQPDFFAFNGDATTLLPSLGSGDPKNMFALLPGISSLSNPRQRGWLIRSANPSENRVYLDDIPVYEPFQLFGAQSVFEASNQQQSYVSRGGYGADQQGGIAGTTLLSLNSGKSRKPVWGFHANLLDAGLSLSVPAGQKISFTAVLRKSFTEYWPNFLFRNLAQKVQVDPYSFSQEEASGYIRASGARYFDVRVKASYRPAPGQEIVATFLGNEQQEERSYVLYAPGRIDGTAGNEHTQYGAGVKWTFPFLKRGNNQLLVHYLDLSRDAQNVFASEDTAQGASFRKEENDREHFSEIQILWKAEIPDKRFHHQFGAGYQFIGLNYGLYGPEGDSEPVLQHRAANHLAQFYYQTRFDVFSWLRVKGGLKGAYDFTVQDFQILPRASVELYPLKKTKLYYLFGRYLQELTRTSRFDSDFRRHPVWYLPDNGTFFTSAIHHIAGLSYENGGFLANLEAYQKTFEDRPVLMHQILLPETQGAVYQLIKNKGINRGLDLFLQYRHSLFSHSVAYSLSEGKEAIYSIQSGRFFPSFNDRTHQVKISEAAAYKGWVVSLNWIYATGAPFLLPDSHSGEWVLGRTAPFSRLDFMLMKQFQWKTFRVETGVSLMNLLDRKNEIDREFYSVPSGNSSGLFQFTYNDLPFSPQFFLSLRFE